MEIARAFPPHLKVDDLGDMHWRCVAPVDLASLVEPGRAETDLECPALLPLHDALTSLGPNFTESSLGPRRTAAEGKDVVKIEDDTGGRCPFVEASTVVVIRLSLSSPLLPPWERPVPPDQSLDDVVPPKAPPPPSPAKTATEAFREECRRVIGELTRDYEAVAESSPEVGITPAVLWQARQKKLKYELNRSGKFLAIRGALKKHVEVRLAPTSVVGGAP